MFRKEEHRVCIFEGEILFVIPKNQENVEKEKNEVAELLTKKFYKSESIRTSNISLKEAPERVIERLLFAMITFQAIGQGVFPCYGNSLFIPTSDIGKSAHKAVELTSTIEDGFIKFYLDPTFLALINIDSSKRQVKEDTEIISLCSFRSKKSCTMVLANCSCPFQDPGELGYIVNVGNAESLSPDQGNEVNKRFGNCPKFSNEANIIEVKYSRKGKNTSFFPAYTIAAKFSSDDLRENPEVRRSYRNATLMESSKRLELTNEWVNRIFFDYATFFL